MIWALSEVHLSNELIGNKARAPNPGLGNLAFPPPPLVGAAHNVPLYNWGHNICPHTSNIQFYFAVCITKMSIILLWYHYNYCVISKRLWGHLYNWK